MKTLLAALALAAPLLAGCLSGGDERDGGRTDAEALVARVTATQPAIDWDVAAQVDWWEDIATNYPKRDAGLPSNTLLRERLVSDLEGIGFDVELRTYPARIQGVDVPPVPGTEVYAIVATKPGTTMPDHRIGLVSHYDTDDLAIQGAYDDASGVATQFSICKALADVPMQRTLACIFFDSEERGLVASEHYVADVVTEGDEPYAYDFVLGYDMTGINWPGHPWKMYAMTGPEEETAALVPFVQGVLHGHLGYPESGVEVLDVHDRNSDEMNFKRAGIPIVRFAGGRDAADYPQWHMPMDTVDYVYEFTGGRPNFEAGFATVVEASFATVLALDRTTLGELRATYA